MTPTFIGGGSMAHIFISYSHQDTEYAHALADSLQSMGFEVWIDERLDYGSQWPQELQTRLDTCSAFILVMSPRSYASEWVQSELQRARRKLKPIFPLLLEGDEPWLSVESTQYYDVRGEVYPDAKFYSALKRVITPTSSASTLQTPKGTIKARQSRNTFTLSRGLALVVGGILLLSFLACAALLMSPLLRNWMNPSAPAASATAGENVSNPSGATEPASVPKSTLTPRPSQPPPNAAPVEGQMALVEAGDFTMGGKAVEELAECQKFEPECNLTWFMDEEPLHDVYVDTFQLDVYEVTNALYQACQDEGVCDPPRASNSSTRTDYYGNPEFADYPVIYVDWNQAKTYCEWRGARLPTEAEWEKAARGTDGRMYPWGAELSESFANFGYSVGDTTAVGSYENGKSPYGLYDMAGNVWEWVSSRYGSYPYDANDGRESATGGDLRVARGGSWGFVGVSVSTAYRYGFDASTADLDLGFRCAKDASP